MTYAVTEVFRTLQGEGALSGTAAVFVRFAGCNLWTGRAEHRERDAARTGARCPGFCDTDFAPRLRLDIVQMADLLERQVPAPLVVFTGGEPMLQLDSELLELAHSRFGTVAVETNGTIALDPDVERRIDHVCVSPKVAAGVLEVRRGAELKVVYPAYDPAAYESLLGGFRYAWVSPEATATGVGKSLVAELNTRMAAEYCMRDPRWRLSLQVHKYAGLQ